MIKPLIQKQILELKYMFFKDRKTGTILKGGKIIGSMALMALVAICCAFSFGMIGELTAQSILPLNMDYLYFSMMSLTSTTLGTFVCMFTASSSIFNAKDNEMLLAMPIRPIDLLISRLLELFILAMGYSALAWLPSIVVYVLHKGFIFPIVVRALIGWVLIGLTVLLLSMIFGYIVSILSRLFKNRSIITILISLAAMAGYYYLNVNMNNYLSQLAVHMDEAVEIFDSYLLLSVFLGKGIAQSRGMLALYTLIIASLTGLAVYVAQRSFIKIATMGSVVRKTVYNNKVKEKNSVMVALLKREWCHFIGSPIYALNTGLGIVFLVAGCIGAIAFKDELGQFAQYISATPQIKNLLPLGILAVSGSVYTMDAMATVAVSLEGKTYWQIRSLPIDSFSVLKAKALLQLLLNGIPYVLCNLILSIVMNVDGSLQVYMILLSIAVAFFAADCDLISGIVWARLKWTSETMVIKQSGNVLISIFTGWVIAFAPAVVYFFVQPFVDCAFYMMACIVLFGFGYRLLEKWIATKGVEKFENLS